MHTLFKALAAATLAAIVSPAGLAHAGTPVDPGALEPPPPPGATCSADGQWVICHTGVTFEPVNEPVFDLPCGTVYETGSDSRRGIRWYQEGKLVKRFVTQQAAMMWSLSADGSSPTVAVTSHDSWWEFYATPGDPSTHYGSTEGDGTTVQAPGYGVIVHIAGRLQNEDVEDFRGVWLTPDDPSVAEKLCDALTR